jgi:transcriptional regulator with XRE-family HTH domain
MTTKDLALGGIAAGTFPTPEQSRMARAALARSLDDAAAASGLSRRTILRVEQAKPVLLGSMDTLRRAYEAAGVRFGDKGGVFPPG